jgi:uncharacterized protein
VMALLLRLFVSPLLEAQAREHAQGADAGHQHHSAGTQISWAARLTDVAAWSDVAHNFRADWRMLWKELAIGFLIAGFVAELPGSVFSGLFLAGSPHALQVVWGAFIGPLIAVVSFVCSVGNVPLAAVLWSHGISFAGVIAFVFADLIVLPILAIYRKYYGARFAVRVAALMFVAMVVAALTIELLFGGLALIPSGARPTARDIFGSFSLDYKLVLNLAAVLIFVALFWLTARRGATDPVCGMKVDRAKALSKPSAGRTLYFCSEHCRRAFDGGDANG